MVFHNRFSSFVSFTGSKQRRAIQDTLRKIGSLNNNKTAAAKNRELITSRRPNSKFKKHATGFTTCPYCKGPYAKSGIRYHIRYKCPQKPIDDERTKDERVIPSLAASVEARYHEDTSPVLAKIITRFQDDDIARVIRFDWLLIVYGNKLSKKYTKLGCIKMIKNKLRLVGRILTALKNIEPEVTNFTKLYHPKYYDSVVEAIRAVARVDIVRNEFLAPATASSGVTAVRQIGKLLIAEYIKKDNRENQRITENFLTLMDSDIHISISKMVNETQSRMARQKRVILPLSDDVRMLSQYLDAQRIECFTELSKSYSFKNWLKLTEFTMASIIVFNRRRVGDTQNILDDDFRRKEDIDDSTNEEMLSDLSESSKRIAKQFSRMKVRGKKNRTVPVLLKAEITSCLTLLLTHRQDAGISSNNLYLFGLPSKNDESKVVEAGRILSKFAKACGAKYPTRLTATNLRKHLATVCVTLKLDDTAVGIVSEHMGHHEKVHRDCYRQNTIDRQIVQMAQVLEAARCKSISYDENEAECDEVFVRKRKIPSPDIEVQSKFKHDFLLFITIRLHFKIFKRHFTLKKLFFSKYLEIQ